MEYSMDLLIHKMAEMNVFISQARASESYDQWPAEIKQKIDDLDNDILRSKLCMSKDLMNIESLIDNLPEEE